MASCVHCFKAPSSPGKAQTQTQLPLSGQALQVGVEVKIGRCSFRVVELLGRGNQGSVWAALQADGGARVAIKETLCKSEAEVVAAEREPLLMQSIVGVAKRDRNIIAFPDVVASETTYDQCGAKVVRFAMTQVPGEPLAKFLHNFMKTTSNANARSAVHYIGDAHGFTFALISQLAAAFQSISQMAFHRDISTENLIVSITRGATKPEFAIIDFGLAVQSDTWPTLVHKSGVAGNCRYWPPSVWYVFMYGGSKLHRQEDLRKEYLTQLDLHSVGVLGVQVFISMLPRFVFASLPEEMLGLSRAWDQYWEQIGPYSTLVHQAADGEISWDSVRQTCISQGVHRLVDSNLIRLHDALEKVSCFCETLASNSPFSNTGSLFKSLAELISHGCTDSSRSITTSWSSVQATLGEKNLLANAASRMPEPASLTQVRQLQIPDPEVVNPLEDVEKVLTPRLSMTRRVSWQRRNELNGKREVEKPRAVAQLRSKDEPEVITPVKTVEKGCIREQVVEKATTVVQVRSKDELEVITPVEAVEKGCIREQVVEKATTVAQVRSKDVPVPAIGQAEKVRVLPLQLRNLCHNAASNSIATRLPITLIS